MSDKGIIGFIITLSVLAIAMGGSLVVWTMREPAPLAQEMQPLPSPTATGGMTASSQPMTATTRVAPTGIESVKRPNPTLPAATETDAAVDRYNPTRMTAPAAPSGTSSLAGAAWIKRNDGSSDLLRGLRVQLLRPKMSSKRLAECFETDLAERKTVMRDYLELPDAEIAGKFKGSNYEKRRQQAKDLYLSSDTVNTCDAITLVAGFYAEKRETIRKLIAEGEQKASSFRLERSAFETAVLTIQVEKWAALFQLEKRTNAIPLDGLVVAEAESDAEGRFVIENVPAGDYCIHAEVSSNVVFFEWAIPIRVEADALLKVNLHNDNAAIIIGP